jgi:hypothetical protein
MPRFCLVWTGLLLLPFAASGQPAADTARSPGALSSHLRRILDERPGTASTGPQVAERLARLATHPRSVNTASADALSALPLLSWTLARRIVSHREEHGPFSEVGDLTAVRGIDRSLLRVLTPYLSVAAPGATPGGPSLTTVLSELDLEVLQRATLDLDRGRGYQDRASGASFRGPPGRLTTRLRLHYNRRAQLALTLDKDPGEALRWRPRRQWFGVDHVAGNLTLRDLGPLETLVLGDYSAQFGQGVTLWRGLTFGKGRDPISPLVRRGRGLVPFQSTAEERFFRGAGATVRLQGLTATGFASHRRRDATLHSPEDPDGRSGPVPARTLSGGGLHRTAGELARRNTLGITTLGGALEYRPAWGAVGVVGYRSRFDRPLRPPERPDRRYAVSGRGTSMVGVFGRAVLDPYTLFAEVSRAPTGRVGGVAGAVLDRGDRLQALLVGRHYPRAFPGLHNSAIGESGDTQNERGLYAGLRLQVAETWHVAAYVDQYRFPWLRFGVPRPSDGMDTRLVVEYEPRPWLSSALQLRADRQEIGRDRRGPGGRRLGGLTTEHRQSIQGRLEYEFSDALTLRTRLNVSRYRTAATQASYGVLVAQGLRLTPLAALQVDARLAVFDTDGYDTRLYMYEHDLLYSFSVPVLYGQGHRSYVLAEYAPWAGLTLEAKYGVTWYPHRQTIGSGPTATGGPATRELRLQVRWQP